MSQDQYKILPFFLDTDKSYDKIDPSSTPFAKGIGFDINANPNLGIGTDNPSGEGSNLFDLTPTRSNEIYSNQIVLPDGYNKNIGYYESITTQEGYYFNFNGNGNHAIYRIDGNSGNWNTVVIDPNLQFTDNQENFISDHRVKLRVVLDKNGNVIEKFLLITDGNSWQKWINVGAAIATNGFDASLFPYWSLLPPHFDRRELLEWPVRPIMYNPIVTPIDNTSDDTGKVNRIIDQAFQIAVRVNNTDGRTSCLSPYSLPLIINSTDFLNNPNNLPKNALITIYAGSPLTESIDIFVRTTPKKTAGVPNKSTWSDWRKYDRIYKFGHDPNVLGTAYWTRTNPWANNSYDTVFNTIQYIFDNSKLADLFPPEDALKLQNDIPQLSKAHTVLGDAQGLANNRYGYDNLSTTQLEKFDISVKEKPTLTCGKEIRKLTLYAYVGRGGRLQNAQPAEVYVSQVGYINGTDDLVRFGGLRPAIFQSQAAFFEIGESNTFQLNFAGKPGFRLYLKGTPYFADAEWVIVNSDNSITDLTDTLDFSSQDVLEFVQQTFKNGGYFAARFVLFVPSDRYIATIGRHNVSSIGDYRSTSTYIMGIANSRVKTAVTIQQTGAIIYNLNTINPNNAIVNLSKEIEIDCTTGDVDVWGNNADLFYIFAPNGSTSKFIEGYFKESSVDPISVELFPYEMTNNATNDSGKITDKNGFYWAATTILNAANINIKFVAKLNCSYPNTFIIPTSETGIGWKKNATAYLANNNNGVVGDCNRILYRGRITNLAGTLGYSNIAVSIKDGMTVYTDNDGNFVLITHNGGPLQPTRNVYVNAGGNFRISIANCGQVPLFSMAESLVACINCTVREYPIPLLLGVNAEGGSEYSLKENSSYSIVAYGADLAGRLQYANVIKNLTVPSFLQRDNTLATYFQTAISGAITLDPDIKWFTFGVSNQLNILKYIQWVGDKLDYIDSNGNVVNDPASAAFCAIYIDSLYNANVANNFSLLASYQFSPEDRMRILDDGEGNLFDTATYGDPIDIQILGTNYNQAAMTAGIIPNVQNPVVNVNTNQTNLNTSITLFVRYDQRLNKLIDKTGFWIELYTPTQLSEEIPFNEMVWRPVINGEIAEFTGYNIGGQPQYNYPVQIDIPFWDTYLFSRNISIPDIGDKFFNHAFESPNISDNWGANVNSGGRLWIKNDNAKQQWFIDDIIKSDDLSPNGIINGLGMFRSINRKDFSQYPIGGIVMVSTERSVVFFLCENDWFITDYQFHYTYANERGVMVTNLSEGLSTPAQKIGDNYGCAYEDTGTIIINDKLIFWYDRKNTSYIKCDYRTALDISQLNEQAGEKGGLQSYLNAKTEFITRWNLTHHKESSFDVIAGIDEERGNVYLTFRPRRQNSNALNSYVNQRRNLDLKHQETFVYSIQYRGWLPSVHYTPEGYGKLRGNYASVEFFAFAAGKPYKQNNTSNDSFLNFFGEQCEPVFIGVFNKDDGINKIFQAISQNIVNTKMFVDLLYDTQTNSFSYIPLNYWKEKEKNQYANILRDMTSYPNLDPNESYKCFLFDGKREFGNYLIVRFVGQYDKRDKYFQLSGVNMLVTSSATTKP